MRPILALLWPKPWPTTEERDDVAMLYSCCTLFLFRVAKAWPSREVEQVRKYESMLICCLLCLCQGHYSQAPFAQVQEASSWPQVHRDHCNGNWADIAQVQ